MALSPSRLPPLLTIPAVAEKLGVCPRTVRRMIARKDLRVHRIGRLLRVAEEDLELPIARCRK